MARAVAPRPEDTAGIDDGAPACCSPLAGEFLGEDEAEELATLMKALADPVRLRLLSLVANAPGDEVCACDLSSPLGRSQPTVSHHLSVLTRAGLLTREQRGKWAWFSVDRARLAQLGEAVGGAQRG